MSRHVIDDVDVVVLDMGNTFMFGCDRFGPDDSIATTYRDIGGRDLTSDRIDSLVRRLLERMLDDARDPTCFDSFGTVAEHLAGLPEAAGLPADEVERIERVFSLHEVGVISDHHASTLKRLRETHPMGLISNVFADASYFERELIRAGVLDLFDTRIWSSAHGSIKPSARLFDMALSRLGIRAERAVYVGDHPRRDVAAASSVGMKTIWVRSAAREIPADGIQPDRIVDDISELA